MWIFNDKARRRTSCLQLNIFLWVLVLAYSAWLGRGGLHAGEAKPSSPVEWKRTLEAAKKDEKVVFSVPASAELRRGIEKVFKQRFGIDVEVNTGSAASV